MQRTIAVLTIGDELLNGEMADTNTAAIAAILEPEGYRVREALTVNDEEGDICEALHYLANRREVVIVTGGLGPTDDDLTAQAAARAFGLKTTADPGALEQINRHFSRLGLPMHPGNAKQASIPVGAAILPNTRGTAPGFEMRQGETDLFFLPGVPEEMTAMLRGAVLPALQQRGGSPAPQQERILTVFGLSEPKTESLLKKQPFPAGVNLAFGVDFPLVHVKLRAAGEGSPGRLEQAEEMTRRALGEFVATSNKEPLADCVGRLLTERGQTLSLAESCTGGLIAKLLTDLPGASAFLERGAVTYANSAKKAWLGVGESLLEEHGAVSAECARAMAQGVRQAAATDLALAVTGIAGPDGGTLEKPVGTVFIAMASRDQMWVKGYRFAGDRQKIRLLTATMALDWLRRHLTGQPIIRPRKS